MLKKLLLLPLAVLAVSSASAQFIYSFKDTTTPYAALTGGTSANGSTIWDEELFAIPLPFTWTMNGSKVLNYFFMDLSGPGVLADTNASANSEGFILGDIDIADRGLLTGSATLSPVRYMTTGTAPNRIFKIEIANAGFFDEMDDHGTANDFINVQIWVYETKNIVEYHYGPSNMVLAAEHFLAGGTGPITGYLRDINSSGTSGEIYFLMGAPSAPTLDSVTLPGGFPTGLNAWPADGKVYRFSPKSAGGVGVPNTPTNNIAVAVFPSITSSYLNINYTPNANEAAEYQICALTGAVIKTGELRSGMQRIDVSAFAAGTYYMQVKSDKGAGVYRFVKQ